MHEKCQCIDSRFLGVPDTEVVNVDCSVVKLNRGDLFRLIRVMINEPARDWIGDPIKLKPKATARICRLNQRGERDN